MYRNTRTYAFIDMCIHLTPPSLARNIHLPTPRQAHLCSCGTWLQLSDIFASVWKLALLRLSSPALTSSHATISYRTNTY